MVSERVKELNKVVKEKFSNREIEIIVNNMPVKGDRIKVKKESDKEVVQNFLDLINKSSDNYDLKTIKRWAQIKRFGAVLKKGRAYVFKPTKAKDGYKELKAMGFYAFASDKHGDWHKNSRIPHIRVLGNIHGYQIWEQSYNIDSVRGYSAVSGEIHDVGTLKSEIWQTLKHEVEELER